MRKIALLILFFAFASCNSNKEKQNEPETDTTATKISGQDLFEGEGNCIACHKPDQKIIGPSLQEIAKIYKRKNGSIVLFLKEESDPIVDPGQYDIMKTNFAITKSMSDEELKALEGYIYSFSK
jgi:cytochrome c